MNDATCVCTVKAISVSILSYSYKLRTYTYTYIPAETIFALLYDTYDLLSDDTEFDTDFPPPEHAIGQCNAIYEYVAQQPDELSIQPGKTYNDVGRIVLIYPRHL